MMKGAAVVLQKEEATGDWRVPFLNASPAIFSLNLKKLGSDILAAMVWAGLAGFNLAAFMAKPAPLQAGLSFFNLIVMTLFILRRPARAKGSRSSFWVAAFATFLPMLALRPAQSGLPLPGILIQNGGLALMLLAIVALNRSFGIAPAHRGLVTHGAYRLVRHPLYSAEMVHIAGYCLGYASAWNGLVWLLLLAAQLERIRTEERLLSQDAAYQAYRRQVPWRLAPGLW